MTFKQKIYNYFLQLVTDKITLLKQVLADLKESSANETKSSAGDKYETALAMLQIEQENTRVQLQEAMLQRDALEKINPLFLSDVVITGSLVQTDKGYFFMSIALGKAKVDGQTVFAISPQSPLGLKLMGVAAPATVEINNFRYNIAAVI